MKFGNSIFNFPRICQNKQSNSALTQPKGSFISVESAQGKFYQSFIIIREALSALIKYKGSVISIALA
jgi:hypothetical protein